ncbi:hypothetical protein [Pseudomonas aeruginosa]|uniref:hypothetical protein n=1 Tax=Pseudomonas aeruginosa TaxID=287 RepID=UPI00129873C5|nr:hypothetical protein [Pseudomonas aeruginosa]MCT0357550.1 hypothetical protein [Pseudomonas aeruginosa]MCT0387753.1 hypothetical protein [Pseudomonas aeruginosa]MDY1346709.1 hypothetical protein [Pseudomonas aeruginosa]
MLDITPSTAVNQPQTFNLQTAADRVCSLISASPIERGDQLEAFVSELTPDHAQISFNVQGGVVQGHLTLTLQSTPPRIWVQFPIPGHEPTAIPGDGVDAQASTLAELIREQMAKRPPVSERFKAFQAQRNRLLQEATER